MQDLCPSLEWGTHSMVIIDGVPTCQFCYHRPTKPTE